MTLDHPRQTRHCQDAQVAGMIVSRAFLEWLWLATEELAKSLSYGRDSG